MSGAYKSRILKEIRNLSQLPSYIQAWPKDDSIEEFEIRMQGPPDTPYETGHFLLQLLLSKNYPFEPPKVQFKTFIYHPNIDDKGRICLDLLKSVPNGTWSSASNIQSTLMTIYSLLRNPNPDDPLSIEAANEYKRERYIFDKKAMEFTKKYANGETTISEEIIIQKNNGVNRSSSNTTENNDKKNKLKSLLSLKRSRGDENNNIDNGELEGNKEKVICLENEDKDKMENRNNLEDKDKVEKKEQKGNKNEKEKVVNQYNENENKIPKEIPKLTPPSRNAPPHPMKVILEDLKNKKELKNEKSNESIGSVSVIKILSKEDPKLSDNRKFNQSSKKIFVKKESNKDILVNEKLNENISSNSVVEIFSEEDLSLSESIKLEKSMNKVSLVELLSENENGNENENENEVLDKGKNKKNKKLNQVVEILSDSELEESEAKTEKTSSVSGKEEKKDKIIINKEKNNNLITKERGKQVNKKEYKQQTLSIEIERKWPEPLKVNINELIKRKKLDLSFKNKLSKS